MEQVNIFLDFLRFSVDDTATMPKSISEIDWNGLYNFAEKQSILGVIFHGLQKLTPKENKPNKDLILKWCLISERIKNINKLLNSLSVEISQSFSDNGYRNCILKGQANAMMYTNCYMRTPGDIDIWVNGERMEITRYIKAQVPSAVVNYHHIHYTYKGVAIEVHYTPSFCGNMFYDARMQKYFFSNQDDQFRNQIKLPDGAGCINILTDSFNRIFQLTHIMHHFFFEGIGFRQIIDYYYLLKRGFTDEEKINDCKVLDHLNMLLFTRAVMFLMKFVFKLDDKFLLIEPDEKTGKLLLDEIMQAGNFGFSDRRYDFAHKGRFGQYMLEIRRNLHFAYYFPSETIFGRPIWRIWHQYYKWNIKRNLQ